MKQAGFGGFEIQGTKNRWSAFPTPLLEPDVSVRVDDITMVLCVRAHAENPWVIDRIRLMAAYYDPIPKVVVIDFGSDPEHALLVRKACEETGFEYNFVEDYGTFSLSAARNRGFECSKTDFVFFCDVDFFGARNFFGAIASYATSVGAREVADIFLNVPAYHVGEFDSEYFFSDVDMDKRGRYIEAYSHYINRAEFDKDRESFIAPYSNMFLVSRTLFDIVGGYDERFRGHGSEDFEFLVRLALHSKNIPLPDAVSEDCLGPFTPEFFNHKPYAGFRRLLELVSQPARVAGFKMFHLWHPRRRSSDWYASNDWKRVVLNEAFDVYVDSHNRLLSVDFLARRKRIACICPDEHAWGYFSVLRAAGYGLVPVYSDGPEEIESLADQLRSGALEGLAIFNPYMKRHSAFLESVLLARELEREVIVIERGALPGTIYYDEDVAYVSTNFSEASYCREVFSDEELRQSSSYIDELRSGAKSLEAMEPYELTSQRHAALKHMSKTICFVPLQLEEDMAVTMFVTGEQSYSDFVSSLPKVVSDNPDIIFVVKPHPLSKGGELPRFQNLIVADRSENVHSLIDLSSFVVCYNSGVGLLAALHEKPTVTLGNAFYRLDGAVQHARSFEEAVSLYVAAGVKAAGRGVLEKLAAWFLFRRYSTFIATDDVVDFAYRKAHNYRDVLVTKLMLNGRRISMRREQEFSPFHWNSYAASSTGVVRPTPQPSARVLTRGEKLEEWARKDYALGDYEKAVGLFLRAYKERPLEANLLRCAAEACYHMGQRREAIDLMDRAGAQMPKNKQLKLRRLVMQYPYLRHVLGDRSFAVVK